MPDYTIPNLKNACRVLKFLASTDQAKTIAEIADALALPRSTALRILFTLSSENLVTKVDRSYGLGSSLIFLGQRATRSNSTLDLAKPVLQRLTEDTGETSQLATLSGNKSLIMLVQDSPHPLAAHSRPGTQADLHCSASGKALLAFSEASKRDLALQEISFDCRTTRTIHSHQGFLKELQLVRQNGYASDEQEYHEGIRCLAAPVFDSSGYASYAIGITAAISRFTDEKKSSYVEYVKNAAATLSDACGASRSTAGP